MKLTAPRRLLACLTLVTALAACGSGHEDPSASPSSPTTTSASPTTAAVAPSESNAGPQTGKIGSATSVRLPTGVQVSIPKIVVHAVPKSVGSGTGIERPGDSEAVLTVVVVNGSARPIDTTLLAVDVEADGEQASGVDYSEVPTNDIAGTILPGKKASGTYGFVIRRSDLGKLQAEVWAGQTEPHAIFTDSDGTT